ncbi:MAG: hypothetical protein R3A11_03935 [Bdellovibrionota bacterium]
MFKRSWNPLHPLFLLSSSLALLVGFSGCSSSNSPRKQKQMSEMKDLSPFELMYELTKHEEPFQFYRDAYGSFSFESYSTFVSLQEQSPETQSELTLEEDSTTNPFSAEPSTTPTEEGLEGFVEDDISSNADQAISIFSMDEKGDFRLFRKLFGELREVEVIQKDQYRWIRYGIKAKYKKTQLHREFETWKRVMLREIFSKYETYAFEKNNESYLENGQSCFKKSQGFVCFDPQTHFPLRGELEESKGADQTLTIQFSVTLSSQEQPITINYPTSYE